MKDGMKQYAFKSGKVKENYLRKHQDGGSGRKAYEASRRDRLQQSRQVQEEEINGEENEDWRQEESVETPKGRQEGIQEPDQGRSEAQEDVNIQQEEEIATTNNQEMVSVKPEARKVRKKKIKK